MTAHHYLAFITIGLVIIGWGTWVYAEENVTIYGQSSSDATASSATAGADSHTTHHRKKKKTSVAAKKPLHNDNGVVTAGAGGGAAKTAASGSTPLLSIPAAPPATGPVTVTQSTPTSQTQITVSDPGAPAAVSGKPEVNTDLPVARPGSKNYTLGSAHAPYLASTFPLPPVLPVGAAVGTYGREKGELDNFAFANFERRAKNVYPWKLNIVTTVFWIGEGATPISSTDNIASAWDQDWRASNRGNDTPGERAEDAPNGYAPAHHAATINPFYVALPFNDLAFPDKARRWLPAGWYRSPRNGKQVSACQHRWVEIKNAQGDVCYAQWEDVGPLRYDHAEYVFGDERPDTYTSAGLDHAGLDVSPAVANYLNINDRNRVTRWRFVDDADVQPGAWLKYDEEALLFKAIINAKEILPIERSREPINDQEDINSDQSKISKAKG